MDLLKLLRQLPEETRIMKPPRKIGGGIRCYDCGTKGTIRFRGLTPVLSPGWQVVAVRLRHRYYCEACARERVRKVMEALRK